MTPGEYLRKRREAAEVSLEDATAAVPNISSIEAGQDAMKIDQVRRLTNLFDFNDHVLLGLAAGYGERVCRECACSWSDPCDPPCSWIDDDLCSACEEVVPA